MKQGRLGDFVMVADIGSGPQDGRAGGIRERENLVQLSGLKMFNHRLNIIHRPRVLKGKDQEGGAGCHPFAF